MSINQFKLQMSNKRQKSSKLLGWEMKTDRRSRKTQAALSEAMMSLLSEKKLKDISVTELAERADVNRATFYTHFNDVYDLYNFMREDICNFADTLIENHAKEIAASDYRGLLLDIFNYLLAHQDIYHLLINDETGLSFFNEITNRIHARFLDLIHPIKTAEKHSAETKIAIAKNKKLAMAVCSYEFNYIVGGIVNVLKVWFDGGCKESVELMVDCTINFIGDDQQANLRKNIALIAK